MTWTVIIVVVLVLVFVVLSLSSKHEKAEEKIKDLEGRIQDLESQNGQDSELGELEFDETDHRPGDMRRTLEVSPEIAALLASIDVAVNEMRQQRAPQSAGDVECLIRIRRIIEALDADEVSALLEAEKHADKGGRE